MFEKGDIMETIRNVEINQLHDFRNHPFKVEVNTELCELMKHQGKRLSDGFTPKQKVELIEMLVKEWHDKQVTMKERKR